MNTPVQLIELTDQAAAFFTYKSHLIVEPGDGPQDQPERCVIKPANPAQPLVAELYHGRFDPDEVMLDWGFTGPTFRCSSLIHEPDRVLLCGCDPHSIALAQRLGLETGGGTIVVHYHDDLLVVPAFRDQQAAYFGDLSINPKQGNCMEH